MVPRYITAAGVISAVLLAIMILTGLTSIEEILEMHFKIVEVCPWCMWVS